MSTPLIGLMPLFTFNALFCYWLRPYFPALLANERLLSCKPAYSRLEILTEEDLFAPLERTEHVLWRRLELVCDLCVTI